MGQIERYDRQIEANYEDIKAKYAVAFVEYNDLMGTNLNITIEDIHPKCGLLIFGKGATHALQGRIVNKRFYGCPCRIIDGMSGTAETLYKILS
jgi:hypothetical protein